MRPGRTRQADKLAKLFDAEILPIWSRRFGKLLLRDLTLPARPMVLDVACGTGYASLEILRRMDPGGRIIAIDASSSMLDEARSKAGPLAGKRIFFRSENVLPQLSFTSDVYDLVVCNAALQEFDEPERLIRDFARVAKVGGQVVVTLPLAGSWREFFDIFREVLVKHDRQDAVDRLDAYLKRFPPIELAQDWFDNAGLDNVTTDYDSFTLLFKSGREFFFAPLVEFGPLADWKEIAGSGEEMQKVFWEAKEAIDAYFGERGFAVTIEVGCVRGTKVEPLPAASEAEPPTGETELGTGEFELEEDARAQLGDDSNDDDDVF